MKKVKVIFQAMAFVLAIGAAFATTALPTTFPQGVPDNECSASPRNFTNAATCEKAGSGITCQVLNSSSQAVPAYADQSDCSLDINILTKVN